MSLSVSKNAFTFSKPIQTQIDALGPDLMKGAGHYFGLYEEARALAAETAKLGLLEFRAGEVADLKAGLFALMRRVYLQKL